MLEHIGDDRSELRKAAEHLKPGGRLIVLAPAHMWLYSEFDRSIGHHRRYSAHVLRAVGPPQPQIRAAFYLDSFGMLASAANRALLRSDMPTAGQLRFWDRWLVRVSRWLDPLLGYRLGKTVVVVWAR